MSGLVGIGLNQAFKEIFGDKEKDILKALAELSQQISQIDAKIDNLQKKANIVEITDFLNHYYSKIAPYKALFEHYRTAIDMYGEASTPRELAQKKRFLLDIYYKTDPNLDRHNINIMGIVREMKTLLVDTVWTVKGQSCNIFGAFDLLDKHVSRWEHQGYQSRKEFRGVALGIFYQYAALAEIAYAEVAADCKARNDTDGLDRADQAKENLQKDVAAVKNMIQRCAVIEHPDLRIFRDTVNGNDWYALYPRVDPAGMKYYPLEFDGTYNMGSNEYIRQMTTTNHILSRAPGNGGVEVISAQVWRGNLQDIHKAYGGKKTLYEIFFDKNEGNFINVGNLPEKTRFATDYYLYRPCSKSDVYKWVTNVVNNDGELNEAVRLVEAWLYMNVPLNSHKKYMLNEKFFSVIKYQGTVNQGKLHSPSPDFPESATADMISGMEASYTLPYADPVTLSVEEVDGAAYQWLVDMSGSGEGFEEIAGATDIEYTVPTLEASMNGWMYRCAIMSESGESGNPDIPEEYIFADPVTLVLTGDGIPEPVTEHDVGTAEELGVALDKVSDGIWDGHTIRLTADITYTNPIALLDHSLKIDLNGYTLTVQPDKTAEPNINPMSNNAQIAAIYELRGNLYVNGDGALNVIAGQGVDYGVYAYASEVTVNDISSTGGGTAAYATDDGSITTDSISATGENAHAIFNFGGTVTVDGSVTADGKSSCGVYIQSYNTMQATVMVGGGIRVSGDNSRGAFVSGKGTWLTVNGGVAVSGIRAGGVTACGGELSNPIDPNEMCAAYITGDITAPSHALNASDRAFVRVVGKVTATEENVSAVTVTGAVVEITGDITSHGIGGTGIRVEAWDLTVPAIGAEVTTLSSITAHTPLLIKALAVEENEHTGDPNEQGLYTFTDGINIVRTKSDALVSTNQNAQVPRITAHPQDVAVRKGGAANLAISAQVSGSGTLSYQWYSNSANDFSSGTLIDGATNASYAPPTDKVGTTYYYVIVTNTDNDAAGEKTAQVISSPVAVTINSGGGGGSTSVTYSVFFDTNGGSSVPSQRLLRNSRVTKPINPSKDGFAFNGWFIDSNLTKAYDFDTAVTGGFTLYAAWKQSNIPAEDKEWNNPFSDVGKSDWFYTAVEYTYENKLFSGTAEGVFSPNIAMTRGMLVTVLHRLAGNPKVSENTEFHDVPTDAYYYKSVLWAAENGIINGVGGNTFAPDGEVTREQVVAILWRYAKFSGADVSVGEDTNISSFNEAFEISKYAVSAIQWAYGSGLITGKPSGTLDPQSGATRAEVAAMLQRFSGIIE